MDKVETKKALKILEKQIKNIFDIIISKMDDAEVNEAMIAKRPLGGWSCGSCQKNIINMSSSLAEH